MAHAHSFIQFYPEGSFKNKPVRRKPLNSYLKWTSGVMTTISLRFSPYMLGWDQRRRKFSTFHIMCCVFKKSSLYFQHDIHNRTISNSYKCSFSLNTCKQCLSEESWTAVAYHHTNPSSSGGVHRAATVWDMQKKKPNSPSSTVGCTARHGQAQAWA